MRTTKGLFLKKLSRLHPEYPELGRERVWLTKRNINRDQTEARIYIYHWKLVNVLYF